MDKFNTLAYSIRHNKKLRKHLGGQVCFTNLFYDPSRAAMEFHFSVTDSDKAEWVVLHHDGVTLINVQVFNRDTVDNQLSMEYMKEELKNGRHL